MLYVSFKAKFCLWIFLTAFCLSKVSLNAQTKFSSTFSSTGFFDWCYNIKQTIDSGYITAGVCYPQGSCCTDAGLIKYDMNGDTLWSAYFGGADQEYGRTVVQTPNGGFLMGGTTRSFGTASAMYLVRCDTIGNLLWSKSIGFQYKDFEGYSIAPTFNGDYVFVGGAEYIPGNGDVVLTRFDSWGNVFWTHIYGGGGSDYGTYVYETHDGGFIITGATTSFNGVLCDILLIKVDFFGNLQWAKTFGGPFEDRGFTVQETNDSGFIIGSSFMTSGIGGAGLIKTDSLGNLQWAKTYRTTNGSEGLAALQTTDGGFILSGSAKGLLSSNDPSWDYVVKTDSSGDTLWTTLFGFKGRSFSIDETTDGGYVLGSMNDNIHIVKMDEFGNSCSNYRTACLVDTHNLNILSPTLLDSVISVQSSYLSIQVTHGGQQFFNTNCSFVDVPLATGKNLFLNFIPNPFSHIAKFDLGNYEWLDKQYTFKIYSARGILIREETISDLQSYSLRRDNLENGFYFFELSSENGRIGSGKFILE